MAKGLYGQLQGNENRTESVRFADRLQDNQIAEGQEVAHLRALVSQRRWDHVEEFTVSLKQAGHSQTRVESMLSRAMAGLKF
jgi:hypothetical protein